MKFKNAALIFLTLQFFTTIAKADNVLIRSPNPQAIWSAEELDRHDALDRPVCTSRIQSKTKNVRGAELEVLGLKSSTQPLSKKFVMFKLKDIDASFVFHSAELQIIKSSQIISHTLVRAETEQFGDALGIALARVNDRDRVIADLKSGNRAKVILYNNAQEVESVDFSLKGSSVAIDACK